MNGSIVATEVLYGGGYASEFAYHLVVPCTLWDTSCSFRLQWQHWSETKELLTRKRIWALVKGSGSSWTAADPRLAFVYDLTDREKVMAVLKEREQLGHDRPKP